MAELKNVRSKLHRVIIDTPALLNMVKHCRETESANAQGFLMGVLQRQEGETVDSLMVTQTMPRANIEVMTDLLRTMENESQRLMDTNEVGFYINSRMGQCFTLDLLKSVLETTKKFKNAVFIVYDKSKSNYGLNPLTAFRLSEKGTQTFTSDHGVIQLELLQSSIIKQKLVLAELFEEVPVKVYRSHMQQAYLFDYIQPEMPAFNTNLFKLSTPNYLCQHVFQATQASEHLVHFETGRQEALQKSLMKLKSSAKSSKEQGAQSSQQISKEDLQSNRLDYFLLSQQVNTVCQQIEDIGLTPSN